MKETELAWTGERMVTSIFSYGAIDHLHRYALALQLVQEKNVLDIASGEGYGTFLLSKTAKFITGVDISEEAVNHASQKYTNKNLTFKKGSADQIPLENNSVDVVSSFETIEHHDRHNEMMAEVKRVLKPGGVFILSSPDKLNYTDIPGSINPFHVKELYREEFKSLLKKYFKNTIFLNQKNVFGSLITPEEKASSYKEFSGNYQAISTFNEMQSPIYNLCVASDEPIEFELISFFSGKNANDFPDPEVISNLRYQLESIQKSNTYRLARLMNAVTKPVRSLLKGK